MNNKYISLSELPINGEASIYSINLPVHWNQKLTSLGFKKGSLIKKLNDFDPLLIKFQDFKIAMHSSLAENIIMNYEK